MAEIVSSLSQLVTAYKTHHRNSQGSPENFSHQLLLFYAVECALKAKYLKDYNGLNTSEFTTLPIGKKYGHGHDILQWVRLLRLPNNGYAENGTGWPILQLHERLRYGTMTQTQRDREQIAFLKHLAATLKNQI